MLIVLFHNFLFFIRFIIALRAISLLHARFPYGDLAIDFGEDLTETIDAALKWPLTTLSNTNQKDGRWNERFEEYTLLGK